MEMMHETMKHVEILSCIWRMNQQLVCHQISQPLIKLNNCSENFFARMRQHHSLCSFFLTIVQKESTSTRLMCDIHAEKWAMTVVSFTRFLSSMSSTEVNDFLEKLLIEKDDVMLLMFFRSYSFYSSFQSAMSLIKLRWTRFEWADHRLSVRKISFSFFMLELCSFLIFYWCIHLFWYS